MHSFSLSLAVSLNTTAGKAQLPVTVSELGIKLWTGFEHTAQKKSHKVIVEEGASPVV